MKLIIGLSLLGFGAPAFAHDGPLLSMAHADFWAMWLIAVAVLLASIGAIISARTNTLPEAPVKQESFALDLATEPAAVSKSFGRAANA